ncbi:MAG: hypothetical protein HY329_06695 [Chloroflexi bacterium]|nr:hypothetical protein [Chloroflexota bacterium]
MDREGAVTIVLDNDRQRVIGEGYGHLVGPYLQRTQMTTPELRLSGVSWTEDFRPPPWGNNDTRVRVLFPDGFEVMGTLALAEGAPVPSVYELHAIEFSGHD